MKSNKIRAKYSKWQVARILIYNSNTQVGCGGRENAVEEALPIVKVFVDLLNNIRESTGYQGIKCELDESGGTYLYIINLEGFSLQAGWLFAGILYKDKWKFGEVFDDLESVTKSINPHYQDSAQLMRIDMHRFENKQKKRHPNL
jgi:hypothetical protein